MTNWQLFISAGLPSLLVLVSMWRADKRMDLMDARAWIVLKPAWTLKVR